MNNLTVQDITPEWVEENCKVIRKKREQTDILDMISFNSAGYLQERNGIGYYQYFPSLEDRNWELEEFLTVLKESVDYSICQYIIGHENRFRNCISDISVFIRPSTTSDPYDDYAEPKFSLMLTYKVQETHDEAVRRVMKAEKGKISRARSKEKKEAAERKQYEELKKKFGD